MCRLAKVSKKDTVYDLGSGDGSAIIVAAKEFGAHATGIECDLSRVLFSRLRISLEGVKNVAVVKDNFYNQNLSQATVVFVYLVPRVLQQLTPKLLAELKPGTKVISYVYTMDLPIVEKNEKEKIYIYKIPAKKNKK